MIIDGLNQGILFVLLQDKYVPGTYSRTGLNMSSVIVVAGVILLFLSVVIDDKLVFGERGLQFMSYDCCSHFTWSHFATLSSFRPLLA